MAKYDGVRVYVGEGGPENVSGVVRLSTPIAVIRSNSINPGFPEDNEAAPRFLRKYPLVVMLNPEARGAAIGACYAEGEANLADSVAAIAAFKAESDSEEPPYMVVHSWQVRTGVLSPSAWLTVNVKRQNDGLSLDLRSVPLRKPFLEHLESRAHGEQSFGVVFLDIDHMMAFNDAYGHIQGDLLLCCVHQRLTEWAATMDTVLYRVAGDKFAAVLDASQVEKTAETWRVLVEEMRVLFEHPEVKTLGLVTASVAALHGKGGGRFSAAALWDMCQDAIYEAKKTGRNAVHLHAF